MDRIYEQLLAIEEGRPYQLTTKQREVMNEFGEFSEGHPSPKLGRLSKPPSVQRLQDVAQTIKRQA